MHWLKYIIRELQNSKRLNDSTDKGVFKISIKLFVKEQKPQ